MKKHWLMICCVVAALIALWLIFRPRKASAAQPVAYRGVDATPEPSTDAYVLNGQAQVLDVLGSLPRL